MTAVSIAPAPAAYAVAVDFSRPPRDVNGWPVWRVRVASANERTCLDCGETTTEEYCPRCAGDKEIGHLQAVKAARLVPTLQYLREGEYERR